MRGVVFACRQQLFVRQPTTPPQADRLFLDLQFLGSGLIVIACGRIQDDASPLCQAVRQLPASDNGFQRRLLGFRQNKGAERAHHFLAGWISGLLLSLIFIVHSTSPRPARQPFRSKIARGADPMRPVVMSAFEPDEQMLRPQAVNAFAPYCLELVLTWLKRTCTVPLSVENP